MSPFSMYKMVKLDHFINGECLSIFEKGKY